ncbi:Trihelix transcription factor GT-2 [Vitis vinifera]|uniref:Trihelix transcription factor GT-2 n=1 Tax=Vitis vinifera TaxID=29760 RepID=A0A438DDT5_VITVI|nr:Trihelix transcription factor GT-2 [Vitis vinifera]
MELFSGDRPITNPDHFPEHIAPFPMAADLIYDEQAAVIRSPEIEHRQQLPPQKLRPIRCNGKAPAEQHSDPQSCELIPEIEDISGNLLSVASPEVGFLSQRMCLLNGASKEFSDSAVKVDVGELEENSGGIFGNGYFEAKAMAALPNITNPNPDDTESSSSSDDGGDSSEGITLPGKRKRKRRTRKKLEFFLESLARKVIKNQEQMHMQLIELLEKRERDRIVREEAWKQQEMDRAKRYEESLENSSLEEEIQNQEIQNQRDLRYDPSNKRWPKSEVQALITLRTTLDHKFRNMGAKGSIWEEISTGMSSMGYTRTAKKCKEKWENINKYYRRSTGSGKKLPYFNELDVLYKNGLINPGNPSNNTNIDPCNSTKTEYEDYEEEDTTKE